MNHFIIVWQVFEFHTKQFYDNGTVTHKQNKTFIGVNWKDNTSLPIQNVQIKNHYGYSEATAVVKFAEYKEINESFYMYEYRVIKPENEIVLNDAAGNY